ncbi:MAG: hypothetical protein ACPGU4_06705 [Flavobacteriales bacterium]
MTASSFAQESFVKKNIFRTSDLVYETSRTIFEANTGADFEKMDRTINCNAKGKTDADKCSGAKITFNERGAVLDSKKYTSRSIGQIVDLENTQNYLLTYTFVATEYHKHKCPMSLWVSDGLRYKNVTANSLFGGAQARNNGVLRYNARRRVINLGASNPNGNGCWEDSNPAFYAEKGNSKAKYIMSGADYRYRRHKLEILKIGNHLTTLIDGIPIERSDLVRMTEGKKFVADKGSYAQGLIAVRTSSPGKLELLSITMKGIDGIDFEQSKANVEYSIQAKKDGKERAFQARMQYNKSNPPQGPIDKGSSTLFGQTSSTSTNRQSKAPTAADYQRERQASTNQKVANYNAVQETVNSFTNKGNTARTQSATSSNSASSDGTQSSQPSTSQPSTSQASRSNNGSRSTSGSHSTQSTSSSSVFNSGYNCSSKVGTGSFNQFFSYRISNSNTIYISEIMGLNDWGNAGGFKAALQSRYSETTSNHIANEYKADGGIIRSLDDLRTKRSQLISSSKQSGKKVVLVGSLLPCRRANTRSSGTNQE